jgi:hypothetical protein
MTKEQILKVIAEHPKAVNLIASSHLGDLPELVEAHVEVIKITRAECVKNYDRDGSSWMPSAVAIGRIATEAGISFYNNGPATRKEGPHCWVGNSQAYRMGPDGKNQDGPPAEKEFDADLQLEAMRIREKTVWTDGKKSTRPYTEDELKANYAQYIVTGRERANTGAKSRAILQLIGQARAFVGLFTEKGEDTDTREILVSRIIWNTKNKMLMERMLDNLSGNTAKLYGPKPAALIPAPTGESSSGIEEPPMRPADDQHTSPAGSSPADLAAQAASGSDLDDAFRLEPEPTTARIDPEVSGLIQSLTDYVATGMLPKDGEKMVQDALDRKERDKVVLQDLVARAKKAYDAVMERRKAGAAGKAAS